MTAPIVTAATSVAAALAADPSLLERLVAFDRAFAKLRNPVLRRTLARLATFADAAKVAGVPLETLLKIANGATQAEAEAGAPPDRPAAAPEPAPAWAQHEDPSRDARLDVRPMLAAGEDPFARIMAVVAGLGPGAVLVLDAPFDPAPLRRVLGNKGFAIHAREVVAGHWRVRFRKPGQGEAAPVTQGFEPKQARVWREGGIAHIDVRGLDPPQPMLAILALLEAPECSATVLVHHEREPHFLYPELAERGWNYEIVPGAPDEVRLALTRRPA